MQYFLSLETLFVPIRKKKRTEWSEWTLCSHEIAFRADSEMLSRPFFLKRLPSNSFFWIQVTNLIKISVMKLFVMLMMSLPYGIHIYMKIIEDWCKLSSINTFLYFAEHCKTFQGSYQVFFFLSCNWQETARTASKAGESYSLPPF